MNNDLPAKRAQLSNLIDLAVEIQQISAPTFSEGPRGEFVRVLFQNEHLQLSLIHISEPTRPD